jgi:hypothetical protein
MQHHRFLGILASDPSSESASWAPAVGAFVLCPLASPPQLALPAPPWEQLYQLAYEQAVEMNRLRLNLERHQKPCWN